MSENISVQFIEIKDEPDVSEMDQQISDVNLVAIKTEPGVTNIETCEEHCDVQVKSETDFNFSNLYPNLHHIHAPFSIDNENLQDEDELQNNEFTSELIIKSENEEESRDNNADSESGNYIQDFISSTIEHKFSAADFQENGKKIEKNAKFCAKCEFTTPFKRILRIHIAAHAESECKIERQVYTENLKCAVGQISSCACQICGRVFQRKANLTRHLKSLLHTQNQQLQSTIRKLNINLDNGYPPKVCAACCQQICNSIKFQEKAAESPQNKTSYRVETTKVINSNKLSNQKGLSIDELVKKYNLKSLRVNITRVSEKVLEELKIRDHEKDIQTSSTREIKQRKKVKLNKCNVCDKTFANVSNLRRHIREVHEALRSFHCNQCEKSLKSRHDLLRHSRVHSDVRQFACEECGKMFKSKDEVKQHMNVHNVELNFKCEQCDKKFKSKNQLYSHKRVHVIVRKFQCLLCKMKFKTNKYLSIHMSVHSDVRPFSCDICAKSFKFKSDLKRHGFVHVTSYDFKCNLCAAKFKSQSLLVGHAKFVHSDTRPYKCNDCGKSFKSKVYIRRHMEGHLNLRQFKCDKCDRSFNYKGDLNNHSVVHSDIFAFKCYDCERMFKNKRYLKAHIFRHHV